MDVLTHVRMYVRNCGGRYVCECMCLCLYIRTHAMYLFLERWVLLIGLGVYFWICLVGFSTFRVQDAGFLLFSVYP